MSDAHEHPAVREMNDFGRRVPGAWAALDEAIVFFRNNGSAMPGYVLVSQVAVTASLIVAGAISNPRGEKLSANATRLAAGLGALGKWRATKGIYRLPDVLMSALIDTPVVGPLPCELLRRLPEWCVYIEFNRQVGSHWLIGAWVHIDRNENHDVLCTLFHTRDGMAHASWEVADGQSVSDALRRAVDLAGQPASHASDALDLVAPVISVVLYLCSVSAEHRDAAATGRQPSNPRMLPNKQGATRIRPPNKPTIWATGTRMGAALDAAYAKQRATGSDGTGRHVVGHIRRAHWHAFWTGPMDGERALRVKWLPPVAVNLDDVPEVATVRPVTGGKR